MMLAGCGGDDEAEADAETAQEAAPPPAPPTSDNAAPTIAGTPPTSVQEGASYDFTPAAEDADGDALIFGIDGKPEWLTFDTGTGRLTGTPTAADVGIYRGIVVWVSDGNAEGLLPPFDLTVTPMAPTENRAPTIGGNPPTSVMAGEAYSFTPTASDEDGDSLSFTIRNRPGWATFDRSTGTLQGTPTPAQAREYRNIVISVTDGKSTVTLPPFAITVALPGGNEAPVIQGTPMTSVEVSQAYEFVPTASDADDDPLTFAVANQPPWATFDTQTGRLAGTPGPNHVGTYADIVISVSDGAASAELPPFTITVTEPTGNTPPTIEGTPPTTAKQGEQYSFTPTAADPDGDPLTYSISNRPTWATFNTSTGRLQGTPGANHVRTYRNIVIRVSDGRATASLPAFSIRVEGTNRPPTISGTPPTSATQGTQYSFTPTAADPDGDELTFAIENRPSWATFNTSTGRLQGTPTAAGTFEDIVISVSDGRGGTGQLEPFTITVTAANGAPTISGTPATAVLVGSAYSFEPSASDPNGDSLTFSITNKPAWATFDESTGRLEGTPGAGDVNNYPNIVISVSDGQTTASLPPFSIAVQAVATGSATLSWTAPTQNSDGSPLTNLAGYKVYWGPSEGDYQSSATINNGGVTTYVVENLGPGTWYFVVTAFNDAGVESGFSNVASKTIE
ncbi:MAG TPA: putative Ig domain-containing protein [Gammaproteobacteria bacterium]